MKDKWGIEKMCKNCCRRGRGDCKRITPSNLKHRVFTTKMKESDVCDEFESHETQNERQLAYFEYTMSCPALYTRYRYRH